MFLKRLEIQGFKSFANKTEIDFKKGITGVVGPNGSGKSNILDAIRWVLGEQSIKTLRGNKMEDIIFSGTDKKRPLGFAEVTIVLDNRDGKILVDYSEVSITRRMFRSGESEYYINKNSCRLKDIKELFMDTGVGKDGYSIIGQGRVDQILSTKSEDRRNIFEEASGIVKYKARKQESEKKLDKTENNLVRINDIVSGLEEQVQPLKIQSFKAENYLKLSSQLKELEINLILNKIDELETKLNNIKAQSGCNIKQLELTVERKKSVEESYFSIKKQINFLDKSIEKLQNEKYDSQSKYEQKQHELNLNNEKQRNFIKEKERLEKEINILKERNQKLCLDRNEIERDIMELNKKLESFTNKLNEKKELMEEINTEILYKEKDIEEKKDNIFKFYNLITDNKSKTNSLITFNENIQKRIIQINKEISELKNANKNNNQIINKICLDKESKKNQLEKLNNSKDDIIDKQDYITKELDILYKKFENKKNIFQSKITTFKLLKNMSDGYQGFYKSVKNVLLACEKNINLNKGVVGVIAELLKVDKKYEKAIEIALGSSLQNIVTKTEEDAKKIINYLKKNKLGRVTFLPITSIRGKKIKIKFNENNGILGVASDLVVFDKKYQDIFDYLLGKTVIVKNIDCGIKMAKRFNHSFKIVSLDGDVINRGGSITGGSFGRNNTTNILNRKFKLESLKKEIDNLNREQNILKDKICSLKTKFDEVKLELSNIESKQQNLSIDLINLNNEKLKLSEYVEKNNQSIDKYLSEIKKLNVQKNDIDRELKEIDLKIEELQRDNVDIKEKLSIMSKKFETKKEEKEKLADEITNFKIQLNDYENEMKSKKYNIENIDSNYDSTTDIIHDEEKRYVFSLEEIKRLEKENRDIYKEKCEYTSIQEKCIKKFESLKKEKNTLIEKMNLYDNELKDINKKINELENDNNKLNVKLTKYSVQIENYNNRLDREYEIDYDCACNYKKNIDNYSNAQQKVNELKKEIKKLGTVNLNAINEYKNLKEKLDFINNQRKDLISAKKSLNNVIKDMEKRMREQFIYNFKIIRQNFNKVFIQLFGGGKADVYLRDEKDVLNSGIEIVAQPPGKKLQSLSLLSGGEKSLTAVALLFAVLKTKPTPFCILDEIDAALDEINICRYTDYLKKLCDKVQFIMITHRKTTMEIADILYGVTMEEHGISKLVSVKLEGEYSERVS